MTQTELNLPIRDHAARARADAGALVSILASRPELERLPARDLCGRIGWTDRRLRAAAEHSDGIILSATGISGYRLAIRASVSSYHDQERRAYLDQISTMQHRLLQMDRAVHACGGSAR